MSLIYNIESVKSWQDLKRQGSDHYKTGTIEPIDLYLSLGIFRPFALASIIKYASRNTGTDGRLVSERDMRKIIHYAELLIASISDHKKGAS